MRKRERIKERMLKNYWYLSLCFEHGDELDGPFYNTGNTEGDRGLGEGYYFLLA